MLTKTDEYALRAVLYLARQDGRTPTPANEIADALALPRNYLSKTLNRLAKRGVLESERGPRGGFRLTRPAHDVGVLDVVGDIAGLRPPELCEHDALTCVPGRPCPLHAWWARLAEGFTRMVERTTVDEFLRPAAVAALPSGRDPNGGSA